MRASRCHTTIRFQTLLLMEIMSTETTKRPHQAHSVLQRHLLVLPVPGRGAPVPTEGSGRSPQGREKMRLLLLLLDPATSMLMLGSGEAPDQLVCCWFNSRGRAVLPKLTSALPWMRYSGMLQPPGLGVGCARYAHTGVWMAPVRGLCVVEALAWAQVGLGHAGGCPSHWAGWCCIALGCWQCPQQAELGTRHCRDGGVCARRHRSAPARSP